MLRQSLEFVAVTAENDSCSGDDRPPSDEGERPLEILELALFIAEENHIPVYCGQPPRCFSGRNRRETTGANLLYNSPAGVGYGGG